MLNKLFIRMPLECLIYQLIGFRLIILRRNNRKVGYEMSKMLNIDQLDSELISLLEQDARQSIGDLATKLGVTRNTVQARLRRLGDSRVLSGFSARIDLAEAGVNVEAFAALALDQGQLDRIVEWLTAIPEVLEIHTTTGREDLLVRIGALSHADLQELIQRIVALPGVSHSNTTLALTTPLHYRVAPLVGKATQDAGWGRSTALPEQFRSN